MFIISVWIFHWKMNAEKNAKAYRVYHVPLATITAERAIFLLQIEVNLIKQQYCSSITENNLSQKKTQTMRKTNGSNLISRRQSSSSLSIFCLFG